MNDNSNLDKQNETHRLAQVDSREVYADSGFDFTPEPSTDAADTSFAEAQAAMAALQKQIHAEIDGGIAQANATSESVERYLLRKD